jgi:hypothetical protein
MFFSPVLTFVAPCLRAFVPDVPFPPSLPFVPPCLRAFPLDSRPRLKSADSERGRGREGH